jgi:hypothetical protein
MACFICNVKGHWSRDCPMATCKFCGNKGHTAAACELQANYKKPTPNTVDEPVTRTRNRKVLTKSLGDILYDNHVTIQHSMRSDVDAFVKAKFTRNGMIDNHALSEHAFYETISTVSDPGHVSVLCYIIAKYCDVSNEHVKSFLRHMASDFNDFTKFHATLRSYGIAPVFKGENMHFRKMTGYCC